MPTTVVTGLLSGSQTRLGLSPSIVLITVSMITLMTSHPTSSQTGKCTSAPTLALVFELKDRAHFEINCSHLVHQS